MAGLGATMLPGVVRAVPANPDVVVVGAGAAGLAAARMLEGNGLTVAVIEAANRVGGRAYTESATFGLPYDHGCAWLQGPDDLALVRHARARGFGLVDHSNARDVLYVGDRRADAATRRQLDRTYGAIEAAIEVERDVAAAEVIPPGLSMTAVAQSWMGPMDFGVDFRDLSTGDVMAYEDYDYDYLVREGLGTLVAAHGAGLPVRLGTVVTGIDWSGEGVRVETTAGTIAARACIVTVSTGVLGSGAIRFTPALPVEKANAIADVPMGLLVKIALQFDGERFGMGDSEFLTYVVPDEVPAEACYFLTFPAGHDIVVGFVGGAFGWDLSAAGEAAAVDFALGEFAGMMGAEARARFRKGHMTDWASNPLTLGAYAAARPGRHGARAVIAEPLGERVFFAGEALSEGYHALCSGAHLSGEAAAVAVVAQLSGPGCSSCDARGQQRERLTGAGDLVEE